MKAGRNKKGDKANEATRRSEPPHDRVSTPIMPHDDAILNDWDHRVRGCYQHCALRWVMSERMTNQSLRERFHLQERKAAIASQITAATIEAGLIKPDEKVGASRKFARYLPYWA